MENILLYEDIEKYKKINSAQDKIKFAELIYKTYFSENSILEANIPKKYSNVIRSKLDSNNALQNIDNTLFEDILTLVKVNLTDTFQRFRRVPEYARYIKTQEFIEQTQGQDLVFNAMKRKSIHLS